jgi:hypothetical protein
MRRSVSGFSLVASLFVLVVVVAHAEPRAIDGLDGRWVLAEQTYGRGASNLAERAPDLHLDVAVDLDRADVKVWSGGEVRRALPWPAVVAGGTPARLDVLEKSVDAGQGKLRTSYRIRPPTEDGLTLDILEQYSLTDDGESLEGTVTVRMTRRGEPRGSFVLHRRFVREPR